MSAPGADEQLRAALQAAAGRVQADPGAYRRLSADWRRRHRRRRAVLAAVASVVFVAVDAVGLWALSQADPHTHVIFTEPAPPVPPVGVDGLGRIGQP